MKQILFLAVIALSSQFALAGPDAPDNDYTKLNLLSYNLRFGELVTLEELAEFIIEQNPDLVALQEVDLNTHRKRAPHQNGKDFATELGLLTRMLPVYGKTIPYSGGYYGIALLSKYPMAKVERKYLPKTEHGTEQRAVLIADVEYQEGKYITFASTHLDYTNTTERQFQVKELNKLLKSASYPVIVGGDFNGTPDSKEIKEGMSDWLRLSKLDPTIPADAPRKTIDYIFGYPENRWTAINATTYSVQLSDHLPTSVVVELK